MSIRKAVVLLSGGIDSTTCLAEAVSDLGADNVIALTITYGQRHSKEIDSACAVAEYYGVRHIKKDLTAVFELSDCSLLSHSSCEIPHEAYSARERGEGPVSTYVPFRNGLFLSCAASIALSLGARYLFYGAHKDDAAGAAYPDCSPEFVRGMYDAILEGTGGVLYLVTPYVYKNKSQVVNRGLNLKAPYHLTWSCYEGKDKPCGACGTCRDRLEAFEMNGIKDPAHN